MIASGDVYLTALGYGLGGSVCLLLLHAVVAARTSGRGGSSASRSGRMVVPGVLVAAATVGAVLVLAGTAGFSLATEGEVAGWPLLIHVGVGGAFTVLLALLALLRSGRSRWRQAAVGPLARIAHWLVLLAGWLTAASVLLATFPIVGGATMERLLDLHRWSGLALAGAALLLGHGMLLGRIARRGGSGGVAAAGSALESRPVEAETRP